MAASLSFKTRVTRRLESLIKQRILLIRNNVGRKDIKLDDVLLLQRDMLRKESDIGIANFLMDNYDMISRLPKPRTKTVKEIQDFVKEARNLILK